ncbi:uncharacterized protein JN550_002481 [Neoarthrinium moseri]|uniref:uncharacterized protein n=1 Tax=Neoarthrinium moseri TaxID=1658444 RepID=UPI001FDE42F1|nr:uncharacterized protein JN550_002481 [Neoarthrinium moseri]KAI1875052.1 hypothetical protein JN550_002481 [Neoarthrinium moseri]
MTGSTSTTNQPASHDGRGIDEIRRVINILDEAGIICCVMGGKALVYYGVPRPFADWHICVPTDKFSEAIAVFARLHDEYEPADKILPQLRSLLHTYPRLKPKGIDMAFYIMPASEHFTEDFDETMMERSRNHIPYPKLEYFAQSLVRNQSWPELCHLVDGMDLTEDWGYENLYLGEADGKEIDFIANKNKKIMASYGDFPNLNPVLATLSPKPKDRRKKWKRIVGEKERMDHKILGYVKTGPYELVLNLTIVHNTAHQKSSSAAAAGTKPSADAKYKIIDRVANFKETEAQRPDFDYSNGPIPVTKSPNPNWEYGSGVSQDATARDAAHREIDPYAADRPMVSNYRLLVSGIAPRPVGFLSTVSADGQSKNLAPFSYFQVIDHDPPMFVVGFSARPGRVKDTYRNLAETGECVINTVSENMIEAVNATSMDAPYGVSEWEIAGLHEAPTSTVRPSRVRESVFSVEGKAVDIKEFNDHARDGMSVASLVLIKATRFWVREDATNADVSHIDLNKLRPIAQLGGMAYGRISSTFDLPRPRWNDE